MSKTWWLIVVVGVGLGLLQQAFFLFSTPWQNDQNHWFSVAFVTMMCAVLPLSLAYRRWRSGPDGYREFQQSVAAHFSDRSRFNKHLVVWVVVAIILVVLVQLKVL